MTGSDRESLMITIRISNDYARQCCWRRRAHINGRRGGDERMLAAARARLPAERALVQSGQPAPQPWRRRALAKWGARESNKGVQ